jgi:predicted O-methyltransferase YrrM
MSNGHMPSIIKEAFPQSEFAQDAFIRDGMSPMELRTLGELVSQAAPARALEIGMANGTSSVVISHALFCTSQGHLTSIDPNQTIQTPLGYGAAGVNAVKRITSRHRLIEEVDYAALPHLIQEGETFDFILIDGYHSFELTFLDLFYADKLLEVGGLLLCHDSSSPAVYKALKWLEASKPYVRLSPPLWSTSMPFWKRLLERINIKARQERHQQWNMLAAYRKKANLPMREHELNEF